MRLRRFLRAYSNSMYCSFCFEFSRASDGDGLEGVAGMLLVDGRAQKGLVLHHVVQPLRSGSAARVDGP